jgi:hypothetical protein
MRCEQSSWKQTSIDWSVCVYVCVRAKVELAVVPWVSREQCLARVLAKSWEAGASSSEEGEEEEGRGRKDWDSSMFSD